MREERESKRGATRENRMCVLLQKKLKKENVSKKRNSRASECVKKVISTQLAKNEGKNRCFFACFPFFFCVFSAKEKRKKRKERSESGSRPSCSSEHCCSNKTKKTKKNKNKKTNKKKTFNKNNNTSNKFQKNKEHKKRSTFLKK